MAEKQNPQAFDSGDSGAPRRSGHHQVDVRDAVAELAGRAQAISQEAGTKVTSAMKDVISAAAGIAGFAIESARDLVQYMVRRGQMTPEEGEKLIRDAEAAHDRRHPGERNRPTASRVTLDRAASAKAEAGARAASLAASTQIRFGGAGAKAAAPPAVAKPVAQSSEKSVRADAKPTASAASAKPAKAAKATKPAKPAKSVKPAKLQAKNAKKRK